MGRLLVPLWFEVRNRYLLFFLLEYWDQCKFNKSLLFETLLLRYFSHLLDYCLHQLHLYLEFFLIPYTLSLGFYLFLEARETPLDCVNF
mmetsp:Transcript_1152/g.1223  ORF Transcript_1152/g.1223 Transcript_1152/m.1223 type:complete len:89 (-) Transcript_1152:203-469(-)